MKLKEIMSQNLQIVAPNTFLQEAAQRMREIDAGPMPVVENRKPIGILTDRDIVIRAVAEGKDSTKTKVSEIMTHEIISCSEDQEIEEGAQLMANKQVRRLMITNKNEELVGIVSLGDLATYINKSIAGETLEEISLKS